MPEGRQVQQMFSAIAGKYDVLNHVLSGGVDFWWWWRMARASGAAPGKRFLDVAAGTGDSSVALARRGAEVLSTDFTHAMLRLGPAKFARKGLAGLIWASSDADAQQLPFRDASFDGLTICYGIRNVEDRPRAYAEFLRVLRPGGQGLLHLVQPARAAPDRSLDQRGRLGLHLPAREHPDLPGSAGLGRGARAGGLPGGPLDQPHGRYRGAACGREGLRAQAIRWRSVTI